MNKKRMNILAGVVLIILGILNITGGVSESQVVNVMIGMLVIALGGFYLRPRR